MIGGPGVNGQGLVPSFTIVQPPAGTFCHITGSPGFPEKLSQMFGVRVVGVLVVFGVGVFDMLVLLSDGQGAAFYRKPRPRLNFTGALSSAMRREFTDVTISSTAGNR